MASEEQVRQMEESLLDDAAATGSILPSRLRALLAMYREQAWVTKRRAYELNPTPSRYYRYVSIQEAPDQATAMADFTVPTLQNTVFHTSNAYFTRTTNELIHPDFSAASSAFLYVAIPEYVGDPTLIYTATRAGAIGNDRSIWVDYADTPVIQLENYDEMGVNLALRPHRVFYRTSTRYGGVARQTVRFVGEVQIGPSHTLPYVDE